MEEDEELRELAGPSGRADDDPEVTQFYVNPIAKPIPQGRAQTSLQDTISDLNMHKPSRNGLEVSSSDGSQLTWSFVCLINRGRIYVGDSETTDVLVGL